VIVNPHFGQVLSSDARTFSQLIFRDRGILQVCPVAFPTECAAIFGHAKCTGLLICALPYRNQDFSNIPLDRLKIMLSSTKPMSEAGLRQFIVRALDKGWVRETWHSEQDRAYRNISDEDIRYGLSRRDWVIESNEKAEKVGFKYLIKTVDIEREELHLLVQPTDEETLKIITKY
jgi:hypothetical protein